MYLAASTATRARHSRNAGNRNSIKFWKIVIAKTYTHTDRGKYHGLMANADKFLSGGECETIVGIYDPLFLFYNGSYSC